MDASNEHLQYYVYVEAKRGQKPQQILDQLQSALGDAAPGKTFVYKWSNEFESGNRDCVQSLPIPGRPISKCTTENIAKVYELVTENPKLQLVPQSPNSPDLNLCDRWLFKELKNKLKQCHLQCASDVLSHTKRLFHQIPLSRFESELRKLSDHCSSVISCNGDYVTK